MSSVSKHILENGLTVLLKEVHAAPLISWWVLYRIGSRNERTGQTGVSHWVEHMMFKGTERYPAQVLDKMLDRLGGTWNAQTSFDYTAYYETMPADKIDLALDLEADRMVNARFDSNEVASERTVIISERQGAENSPMFWLSEEIQAAAFRVHGYHHEIIGDLHDLETMTREDLYSHYLNYYAPNNAIVVAVGAFDSAEMLERIKALYGSIPARDVPALFARPEPAQQGERRVCVERPGTTAFLEVAYHAPGASDPDYYPLAILNSVLAGPSGPGGSNIDNKTSRLYRGLVATELAAAVDGSLLPSVDPFLYSITVTARAERTLEEIEAALDAELQRILDGELSEAEVAKAKKQARASFAYSTESVTGQAFWLAFCENIGGYEWFEQYVDRLDQVSRDDVLRVARQVLRKQNRVVGWLVPTGMGEESEEFDDE